MSDDNRSDSILRHFKSRSQQPRVIAANAQIPPPANVFVVMDSCLDNVDYDPSMRFRYMGTTPQLSNMNMSNNRQLQTSFMRDGFSS